MGWVKTSGFWVADSFTTNVDLMSIAWQKSKSYLQRSESTPHVKFGWMSVNPHESLLKFLQKNNMPLYNKEHSKF